MNYLEQLGLPTWIMTIVIVLAAFQFVIGLLDTLAKRFGIKTKWRTKQEDVDKIIQQCQDDINQLRQELKKHEQDAYEQQLKRKEQSLNIQEMLTNDQKELQKEIKDLYTLTIDTKIDDMRWEILNFADMCHQRPCNKEQYNHCLDQYEKYQKILAENDLENGKVDLSMEFIKKQYLRLLDEEASGI